MSAESARIIRAISNKKSIPRVLSLGTIIGISPLALKIDGLAYEISSNVLKNESLVELKEGDRVLTVAINNTNYIIICKVV